MSLPHALLGLLAVAPRSGYELTKAFAGDLGRYAWQAGHTSIYPELARMAEGGLIEVTHEGARGARTYAVTDAGRDELRTWLLTPPAQAAKVRNEQVLRMFLLPALDPADAREVLGRIAAAAAPDRAELRASIAGSQVVGLAMARYIVRVPPLADAEREEIVAAVGPTIQRYLTGTLGPA